MYYRIYDKQTGCYMATAYNSKTFKEMKDDFISYKSVDSSVTPLKKMNRKDFVNYMESEDFILEQELTKFEEYE
jgi:hypothetical protein